MEKIRTIDNSTKYLHEIEKIFRRSYLKWIFHEDNPKVKKMTEEPVRNQKTAFSEANIDHGYIYH